jgi:1-acyl-sn-glycerol-3-phosphate acyltransferase
MPEPGANDPDGGFTVELTRSEYEKRLPAPAHPSDQLPGLEPERQITDWGRSERVEGVVDRVVYDFLYHYWFRVEVEGIENIPDDGGVLLLANHAGALPSDGAMISKAIRQRHPRRRAVHLIAQRQFAHLPGLGMLVTKLGGISNHPANVRRLLLDEGQLVLAFPEGRAVTQKPLKERYRLRRFEEPGLIETAVRAGVPIVPVAVLGAEEAVPVIARLSPRRIVARLPGLSIASLLPLPAKFRIRFLEPVDTAGLQPDAWRDKALIQALAQDIRALLQENVFELVATRRNVWLG